jgi:diacylglycerol kinase family enzyme
VPKPADKWAGVIVNPRSGKHDDARAETITHLLKHAGIPARVVEGRDRGGIQSAAAGLLDDGCSVLAAAGGDGTVGTVAEVAVGKEITLAVLPCGTLNHFARDLRIPLDLPGAIGVIKSGRAVCLDAGEVNGHVFINNSSLGIYPLFVRERRRRRGVGRLSRIASVAKASWRIARNLPMLEVRMTTASGTSTRATPFVFVGNNVYELEGLRVGSRPALDQGRLSVCVAEVVDATGLVRLLFRALAGTLREDREFQVLTTNEVLVDTGRRRVSVANDGEVIRISGSLHYRILSRALRVLVP